MTLQPIWRSVVANIAWIGAVLCLMKWNGPDRDMWLAGAVVCGIVFVVLLRRIGEGRGLLRALALVLLAFSCMFFILCVALGLTEPDRIDIRILVPATMALAFYKGFKQTAEEEDDPVFPVTRSWFGRRAVSADLDCPCEEGRELAKARAVIARLEGKCEQLAYKCERLEDKCERQALEAKHNRAGQLEGIEAILTLPGMYQKLRSFVHPDKHPEATPGEKRRFNEAFKTLTAIYNRLGRE